jgi:outer membrane receptor protein involved in Fe transport
MLRNTCVLAAALWATSALADQGTTVTGQAPPATASERRIDARAIAAVPRRSGDDLLRLVPGVLISRHGAEGKASQIFLRGFDAIHGADVEVLCAGIPINELSNVHGQGYLDLGFLLPETVREILVQKGPFAPEQGNFATAGSLRVQLGVPEAARGLRAHYEIGTTQRHRLLLLLAPRSLPEETFLAAEAMTDQGYGQNRAAGRLGLTAQARLLRRGGYSARTTLLLHAGRFGEPAPVPLSDLQDGRVGFFDTYARDTSGTSHRAVLALSGAFNDGARRAEATLYAGWRRLSLFENFTGYLLDPVHGDTRHQVQTALTLGLRLSYQHRLPRSLALQGGVTLQGESIGQYEDQVDERRRPTRRGRDLDITQLALGAHLALSGRPLPWLRFSAGARLDLFHFGVQDRTAQAEAGAGPGQGPGQGQGLSSAVSPRLSLSAPLPRRVTLFAAYGRGVRAPEARSVLDAGKVIETLELSEYGGRVAELTVADAVEAGLRAAWPHHGAPLLEVSAAGFATFVEREVLFDHVAAISVALGSTRRLGAEASILYTPRPWLQLQGDVTYVDARFTDSGGPVPGVPRLLGTVSGSFLHPRGLRAGVRLFWLLPRPLRYGATAGGAVVLDVSAGYRWRSLQVDLTLDNTLNYQWREGEFHYASWFDRSRPRSEIPSIHYAAGPPLTLRAGLTVWF